MRETLCPGALDPLARADAFAAQEIGVLASLAPDRPHITPLHTLGQQLLSPADPPALQRAFSQGVCAILIAQVRDFPETLYWDMDHMASSLLEQGRAHGAAALTTLCEDIASIQRQYGKHSIIRFRYVHDFSYGFDWAKWVARAPQTRKHVGPFDHRFIRHLMRRGEELVALIMADDEAYPKLTDGRPRNPFGFSRSPPNERRLFAELAAQDLIPVRTWLVHASPVWQRDFASQRDACARALGVPTRHTST